MPENLKKSANHRHPPTDFTFPAINHLPAWFRFGLQKPPQTSRQLAVDMGELANSPTRQLANSPIRQLAWEGSRLFATQKQISLNQASTAKSTWWERPKRGLVSFIFLRQSDVWGGPYYCVSSLRALWDRVEIPKRFHILRLFSSVFVKSNVASPVSCTSSPELTCFGDSGSGDTRTQPSWLFRRAIVAHTACALPPIVAQMRVTRSSAPEPEKSPGLELFRSRGHASVPPWGAHGSRVDE
jgi:hypothetical protein